MSLIAITLASQPLRSRLPDVQPDIASDVRRHEDSPPEEQPASSLLSRPPGSGASLSAGDPRPRNRSTILITFITATTLPLLIALAEIGERDGIMLPATAAALVGAGVLSVLVYPLIAVGLHRSAPLTPENVGITSAETATGTNAPPETG